MKLSIDVEVNRRRALTQPADAVLPPEPAARPHREEPFVHQAGGLVREWRVDDDAKECVDA